MTKILQGIDIVQVCRIQRSIQKQKETFLKRVFTLKERSYCEPRRRKFEHYAARFAAKEAVMKALPMQDRVIEFREIEITHETSGRPKVNLAESALKKLKLPRNFKLDVSLSHDETFAVASAIYYVP